MRDRETIQQLESIAEGTSSSDRIGPPVPTRSPESSVGNHRPQIRAGRPGEKRPRARSNSSRRVSLSVLVPVYNEQYLVAESLARLEVLKKDQTLSRIEVIVVDDGSHRAAIVNGLPGNSFVMKRILARVARSGRHSSTLPARSRSSTTPTSNMIRPTFREL